MFWRSLLFAQPTKLYRQTLFVCWAEFLVIFPIFFHQTKKSIMRIIGKVLRWFTAIFVLLLLLGGGWYFFEAKKINTVYSQLGEKAPVLTIDNLTFRDLNKNGKLDPYEDDRNSTEKRVEDLLSQMTLEEKAGTMFISMIGMTQKGGHLDLPPLNFDPLNIVFYTILSSNAEMLVNRKMTHFNIINSYSPDVLAKFNNTLQEKAERSRLGIPITIATDPRHGKKNNPGAAIYTPSFSQWPTSLGLAATRDTTLVREFGEIAREDYKATGIRLALHPMADLATEPRWGRSNGTFGEDASLSAAMTYAYVKGFQGDTLTNESVVCMTKHFSGGGPQKDGEDAHFPYGSEQVYPGNNFNYHIRPFTEGAFPANTGQIMPYYGIPVGQTKEDVAFAFNKQIITQMLRDSLKFDGVICTDWNIINDKGLDKARAWGVEDLSPKERMLKVIEAGCDQFGGEDTPEQLIALVKQGKLSEDRIDISVRRLLRDKFTLGLFENPYVDPDKALKITTSSYKRNKAEQAQIKSTVLLKNETILPIKRGINIFLDGFETSKAFDSYGKVVQTVKEADVVVVKRNTPFDERNEYFLEQFFHQGRLNFTPEELAPIKAYAKEKPVITIINLERAAILTEIAAYSKGLLAEFGATDATLAKILFGEASPKGKLPIELPRSQQAVEAQLEDVPYDSENPLFPFGFGLNYDTK